jgi:predicted DNA-binding protein (UPF0251 family)
MLELDEVRLTVDEREAIRLSDLIGLSHEEAGHRMGVSRATFGRIIQRARKAIADAIINGKAINVEGGKYKLIETPRIFNCLDCEYQWEEPCGSGRPHRCPQCESKDFQRENSLENKEMPPK